MKAAVSRAVGSCVCGFATAVLSNVSVTIMVKYQLSIR